MVHILFKTQSHYPVNRQKVLDAVDQALAPKFTHDVEVSITILGDRQMRHLNQTYRSLDKTTDVLSFPLSETSNPTVQFVDAPDSVLRLGDIAVSYPQAVEEASESDTYVDDVIVKLVLHGINHLLGIHHPE